jgi:hypothetical protein
MRNFPVFSTLLLCIAFAVPATAQQPYFSYRTLTKGDHISFPVFASNTNATAATDINRLLQVRELQVLDGYYKDNIFEGIADPQDEAVYYTYDVSFDVKENTPRLLSLRFNISSCGATCYYWSSCYNFNPQTGEPVQLGDLFTAEGLDSFEKKAKGRWNAQIDAVIKGPDAETLEIMEPFRGCFDDTFILLESFYIQGDDLYIDAENCLPKYAKFYDIDTAVRFSIKELTSYMNDYGRSVFGLSKELPTAYKGELLKELIVGTNPHKDIVLALVIEGHTIITGYYAAIRNGIYAPLDGAYENGKMNCEVIDDGARTIARVSATIEGDRITVVYEDASGNKMPAVALKRE